MLLIWSFFSSSLCMKYRNYVCSNFVFLRPWWLLLIWNFFSSSLCIKYRNYGCFNFVFLQPWWLLLAFSTFIYTYTVLSLPPYVFSHFLYCICWENHSFFYIYQVYQILNMLLKIKMNSRIVLYFRFHYLNKYFK